jgi:hypothetical protein
MQTAFSESSLQYLPELRHNAAPEAKGHSWQESGRRPKQHRLYRSWEQFNA